VAARKPQASKRDRTHRCRECDQPLPDHFYLEDNQLRALGRLKDRVAEEGWLLEFKPIRVGGMIDATLRRKGESVVGDTALIGNKTVHQVEVMVDAVIDGRRRTA